ncbi:MAG TPA: DUF1244 domain-containing protein [Gammaproteobacteria bacterium]|nr:DUF1244 domain-containing protein [Gammaproteobacteria bacterium]
MIDKDSKTVEIEAATFRRLLAHLDANKEVQNIDLMNLASFCRNCLSKWYSAEAKEMGLDIDYEEARELVYGMPYSEWKGQYQPDATPDQLAQFKSKG